MSEKIPLTNLLVDVVQELLDSVEFDNDRPLLEEFIRAANAGQDLTEDGACWLADMTETTPQYWLNMQRDQKEREAKG